jgi:hypothetical protein
MQIFQLVPNAQLTIQSEIMPIQLQDIKIGDKKVVEKNLEDLIVEYPHLLNYGDCEIELCDTAEILIISRQTRTTTNKISDLLGLHIDGSLVIIEVKRDIADEKVRREALEFQAIRYAASSRKLTVQGIVALFARYLWKCDHPDDNSVYVGEEEAKYKAKAVKRICDHLSDEEATVDEDNLDDIINPREKQRIFLVDADYQEDVTSACAWLREYEIDISCFRLRPYKIGDQYVLQRERLIPPQELDDFMVDTKLHTARGGGGVTGITRAKSVKPVRMTWGQGDEQTVLDVVSWTGFLEQCVSKGLGMGLPIEKLPMKKRTVNGEHQDFGAEKPFFRDIVKKISGTVFLVKHASACVHFHGAVGIRVRDQFIQFVGSDDVGRRLIGRGPAEIGIIPAKRPREDR